MYFLIGNEHVQTSEHRHSVKLFVRGVGQHGLDDVLLVRFGFHSTLARPESVVFKEPFECKLGLWGCEFFVHILYAKNWTNFLCTPV